jgi:hypothetical protein
VILGHKHITTTQRYVHVAGDVAARDQRARLSFAAPAVAEVVEIGQRVGS